jgi:hypothetical protein
MDMQRVEKTIVNLRNCRVILDHDVAALYGVETKRVNEAVRNNPEKFPEGYVLQLTREESSCLRSKISTLNRGQHSKYLPKAFTEKGLYMLATILKSPSATQTTIAIVETFARFKEFTRTVSHMAATEDEEKRKELMGRGAECLSELLDGELQVYDMETTLEVNLAMLKFKHIVKRKK